MRAQRLKIFFDGGCQPNPGVMQTAVVVRGAVSITNDIGWGTNNDAEWLALIAAVRMARTLDDIPIVLLGDSALVVTQANGLAPCRHPMLRTHLSEFERLRATMPKFQVRQIKRTQNLAGIALDAANLVRAASAARTP